MAYAPDDMPWCADCLTSIPKTGVPCAYNLATDELLCAPCHQQRESPTPTERPPDG